MAFGCAGEAPLLRQHRMIFDKPFLLLMERTARNALLCPLGGQPELLVPW